MADQLFDSTKLRILPVVDLFTWFARQRKSYGAGAMVNTLERITKLYGVPREISGDNDPELVSRTLALSAYVGVIDFDFFRLEKPTDNCFLEASTTNSGKNA